MAVDKIEIKISEMPEVATIVADLEPIMDEEGEAALTVVCRTCNGICKLANVEDLVFAFDDEIRTTSEETLAPNVCLISRYQELILHESGVRCTVVPFFHVDCLPDVQKLSALLERVWAMSCHSSASFFSDMKELIDECCEFLREFEIDVVISIANEKFESHSRGLAPSPESEKLWNIGIGQILAVIPCSVKPAKI